MRRRRQNRVWEPEIEKQPPPPAAATAAAYGGSFGAHGYDSDFDGDGGDGGGLLGGLLDPVWEPLLLLFRAAWFALTIGIVWGLLAEVYATWWDAERWWSRYRLRDGDDAEKFLWSCSNRLRMLASRFWWRKQTGHLPMRLLSFVLNRWRPLASVFFAYLAVVYLRWHSQFILLLDEVGLSWLGDMLVRASSVVPFSGLTLFGGGSELEMPELLEEDEDEDEGEASALATELALAQAEHQVQNTRKAERTLLAAPAEDTPVAPILRPKNWLVYDKVFGAIPREVAERWRQEEEMREVDEQLAGPTRPRRLPPVRTPPPQPTAAKD